MAEIIDGKVLSLKIKEEAKINALDFENKYGRKVTLAVVLVGSDPASMIYVKNKIKAAEFVGIKSLSFNLPENSSQKDVESIVEFLANDNCVDGILVQLPLPNGINEDSVLSLIPANKDVDGFTSENMGKLVQFKNAVTACTPSGIIYMLKSTGVSLCGKHAVIIGRSNIVGKPIAFLLLRENCTVTVCHSKTENLKNIVKHADIVVAAVGKPEFVTSDMIKKDAIVIDVGINRTENGICGDVDFKSVYKKASYITPVPGGVGPMTIAMLMKNVCDCAKRRKND